MKKTLYIMVGPAGAGKTTWLKENCNPKKDAVISRDLIRFAMINGKQDYFDREKEVYNTWVQKIQEAIDADNLIKNVYCDATNLTERTRDRLLNKLNLANVKRICALVAFPPVEEALRRNMGRDGLRYVPEDVIRKMYDRFEAPENDTNFPKEVFYIEGGLND